MQNAKPKMTELGAFWKKTAKSGIEFMTGVITINGVKTDAVVFANKDKKVENQPDWRMYLSEKREQATQGQETQLQPPSSSPF